ncbi:MAG: hypothetical protein JXR30_02180 [Alphaproteobacteria bacterium]|nr:hypothetical protein [Alphaproteobacteria bacterium]
MQPSIVEFYTFPSFADSLDRAKVSLCQFVSIFEKYNVDLFMQNQFNSNKSSNEFLGKNSTGFNLFKRRLNNSFRERGANKGLRLFYANYFTENKTFVFLINLQGAYYFNHKNTVISQEKDHFSRATEFLENVENSDYFGNNLYIINPSQPISPKKEQIVSLDFSTNISNIDYGRQNTRS